MTDLFLRLTPDWVLRAIEAGGFEPSGHVLALNSLENRVYDLRLDDDEGTHVVAKFYRPGRWSKDAIRAEHAFLAELKVAEIPVCAPLSFADGDTLHEVEGIAYAVWPRTGGRAPDELTDEQVEQLGRLVARIHNVGASKPAPARRVMSAESYVLEPLAVIEKLIPREWGARYRSAALSVAEVYRREAAGVPVHRIHGDCHLGNLLRGREGFFFLDFDDMLVGPAVQDLWLLMAGGEATDLAQRALFVEAYQQFRPFQHRWLRLIEPLRAMRWIHYSAWVARRWNDPAFPHAFPDFGTPKYWERETLDLERQIVNIREALA